MRDIEEQFPAFNAIAVVRQNLAVVEGWELLSRVDYVEPHSLHSLGRWFIYLAPEAEHETCYDIDQLNKVADSVWFDVPANFSVSRTASFSRRRHTLNMPYHGVSEWVEASPDSTASVTETRGGEVQSLEAARLSFRMLDLVVLPDKSVSSQINWPTFSLPIAERGIRKALRRSQRNYHKRVHIEKSKLQLTDDSSTMDEL